MVFKVHLIQPHAYASSWQLAIFYVPHQKKSFAKYKWRTYNRWQITLIPIVSSSDMTYVNEISVLAEEHNRYMIYIITYPPSGARAFNAARIILHTLRERIHVLRKRQQDIVRSPCPSCAVVASRTIDTQPLPHDRDCPQANLVLRGRVRNSHHLVEGYLPSYLDIDVSLWNSKLHKVNAESLACHLLRLL
jgi:hypothetical protein